MAVRNRDRFIALFFASIFIVSICALTLIVILDNIQRSKLDNGAASQQTTDTSKENKNMLKGTQLNGFTAVANIPELQKIDIEPGTGAEVKPGATVTVDYTGALASNGVIFESSKDSGQTATFPLSGVIAGWTQGVPGMKEGGTRRLLIPSDLAYGAAGAGSIPANADLVFDITLHKIGE